MRDFDIARAEREDGDRQIRLAGVDLTFRAYIWPDQLVKLQDISNDAEFLDLADTVFAKHVLEPGQEKKWAKVRSEDNPLAPSVLDRLASLNVWLARVVDKRTSAPAAMISSFARVNAPLARKAALTLSISSTGMPSVMQTIKPTPASAASRMESAANGGGT